MDELRLQKGKMGAVVTISLETPHGKRGHVRIEIYNLVAVAT